MIQQSHSVPPQSHPKQGFVVVSLIGFVIVDVMDDVEEDEREPGSVISAVFDVVVVNWKKKKTRGERHVSQLDMVASAVADGLTL